LLATNPESVQYTFLLQEVRKLVYFVLGCWERPVAETSQTGKQASASWWPSWAIFSHSCLGCRASPNIQVSQFVGEARQCRFSWGWDTWKGAIYKCPEEIYCQSQCNLQDQAGTSHGISICTSVSSWPVLFPELQNGLDLGPKISGIAVSSTSCGSLMHVWSRGE